MPFLVVASMLFSFSMAVLLFEGAGRRADDKRRRLRLISEKPPSLDEELEVPFVERFFIPAFYKLVRLVSRLTPQRGQKDNAILEKKLRQAGMGIPAADYAAAKLMVLLGTLGVSILLAIFVGSTLFPKLLILWAGIFLSVLGPNLYLSTRIKNRMGAIRNQMPDIMDLLTVCVEAGLGFDAALLKIEERFEGPLVSEFMIVQREIQMGLPKREALKKFADRIELPEMKTFVGAIVQAEQMGLPIKNVLRSQSHQLRQTRKQIAEEKAMKAPIKMMLPMVLFIFPVIFIVLLGPTVLQLLKTFG